MKLIFGYCFLIHASPRLVYESLSYVGSMLGQGGRLRVGLESGVGVGSGLVDAATLAGGRVEDGRGYFMATHDLQGQDWGGGRVTVPFRCRG
jgi:hypothetical protein